MTLVPMDCLSTAECLLLQLEGGPVGWSSFRYTPSQVGYSTVVINKTPLFRKDSLLKRGVLLITTVDYPNIPLHFPFKKNLKKRIGTL